MIASSPCLLRTDRGGGGFDVVCGRRHTDIPQMQIDTFDMHGCVSVKINIDYDDHRKHARTLPYTAVNVCVSVAEQ
jgi:hypothetical protein